MNTILKDNIYWLEVPTMVNLSEWLPQMKYPDILIDGMEDIDDNAVLVAYAFDSEASGQLASIATASDRYIWEKGYVYGNSVFGVEMR